MYMYQNVHTHTSNSAISINNRMNRRQYRNVFSVPKVSNGPKFLISLRTSSKLGLVLKAESHCSENETDNDQDAKRTPSIG